MPRWCSLHPFSSRLNLPRSLTDQKLSWWLRSDLCQRLGGQRSAKEKTQIYKKQKGKKQYLEQIINSALSPEGSPQGFQMLVGLAVSVDGGVTWQWQSHTRSQTDENNAKRTNRARIQLSTETQFLSMITLFLSEIIGVRLFLFAKQDQSHQICLIVYLSATRIIDEISLLKFVLLESLLGISDWNF